MPERMKSFAGNSRSKTIVIVSGMIAGGAIGGLLLRSWALHRSSLWEFLIFGSLLGLWIGGIGRLLQWLVP
jgi:hypothetical protein